ncbi:maleate cis-trans isomerase family protein [Plantactinospora sp. WMMB334]|uniref:maleate cis-trans isomerase family protein n=1 Tax=Plantactinospora sp. WMMB334 TaxID=3404119 RepID=UPI003B94B4B3
MWKPDGWDSEFKLGVVAPHADVGPEAEAQAILAGHPVTVHGARVHFAPMHPGGHIDDKIAHDPVLRFIQPDVIDPTVESLSSAPLDAIGLAFTSSSFKIGAAGERDLLTRLARSSHGIRLVTTGTATVTAIQTLELTRIAVMAPSWFDDDLCGAGGSYFTEQGVDVVSVTPSGPPGGPLAITPAATAEAVRALVARTKARAVFIAGNGQRAIGAIDQIEHELGVTALTANQVLVWSCLEGIALRGRIKGYGRLFSFG